MITVYGRATSSNVQSLLWGMEELGLTYSRLDRGEVFGGLDTPEFRALNPHGLIPVVTIGDHALFESGAILRYLAGQYGQGSFWPRDALARAAVDMWAEWAKHAVAAAFTGPVFWRHTRTHPDRRDTALVRRNLAALEEQLEKVEARLAKHAYLCGQDLTLADIQLGHILYRYFDIDIRRRELPALAAYAARLAERPAYQKAVMVSYDSLRNTF